MDIFLEESDSKPQARVGIPSTVQDVLGCVQIVFSASWFTTESNPLAKPLFWACSTLSVLSFSFPSPLGND